MGLNALVYFVLKFKFTIAQIQGLKYTDIIHIQMDNILLSVVASILEVWSSQQLQLSEVNETTFPVKQVALDKKAGEHTRLLYCTTGVLLEKLISMKEMNDYTHIILDEVHEREVDMDFAMLIIKDFLRNNSPNVKVRPGMSFWSVK